MEQKDMDRVQEIVSELAPDLKELTLKIHDNPELGNQEHKACRWQMELLQKYGFETSDNFCDIPTAYKAVYKGKKPGPKIAMLAEYDALPELGHGCGHNLIAMISVGSGIAMREFADEYGGEIHVIGTPAEETAGAKVEMSAKGAFKEYDVAMMAHPFEENGSSINTLAMSCRLYEFFGKTAHAAAAPEEGKNALDAMINFFNMVNALRQQATPDVRIHGIITRGGEAPNVIPDYTESIFYVRANRHQDLDPLFARVENCARGAAMGAGVSYTAEFTQGNNKDTCSNMALAELIATQMEKLGAVVKRTHGEYTPGSSDMGDVSYRCPAVQSTFDINSGRGAIAHTREFTQCAGSPEGIQAARRVICGFVMTAAELMSNPTYLKEIKHEFENMTR